MKSMNSSKIRAISAALPTVAVALLLAACTTAAPAVRPTDTRAEATTPSPTPASLPAESASPTPAPIVDGTQITAVGDSVMLASSDALEREFPGIDVHAEVSNQLANADDQLRALEDAGQLRSVVIVGMGVNGVGGEQDVTDIIDVVGERRIVFVNAHGPRQYVASVNSGIAKAAERAPTAAVADWDAVISQRPELLARDDVHPGAEGAVLYADVIRDALSQGAR